MAELQSRALALFDFDGTLIKGDSIVSFIRLARRLNAFSRWEYIAICFSSLKYALGLSSAQKAKERALRFLTRLSPDRKMALEMAFAHECLLPRVYPEGVKEIQRHKKEGRLLVMISASTENYMQHIVPALGFDALLCTPLSDNGILGENCRGEEKVRRLEQWLKENEIQADFSASFAYGDSLSDLPMLQKAGHPTLVNPSKKLIQAAPQMPRAAWGKK